MYALSQPLRHGSLWQYEHYETSVGFSAYHSSYWVCILIQRPFDVPNAADSLSDISAEMLASPVMTFSSSTSVRPIRLANLALV